ncbi:MAG: hypothetical protein L0I79_00070 [Atopostipes sp.]|nr:hypothetical protein [Atopostipes sp.]
MAEKIYTNYWISYRDGLKKEHGSYSSEEEALQGIEAWWTLHGEQHDYKTERTNTDALEITYDDPNYFYRIEENKSMDTLPERSYRVKSQGEIDGLRKRYRLNDVSYVFDELAEPYRDRIMLAMNSIQKARAYSYTEKGKPIVELTE